MIHIQTNANLGDLGNILNKNAQINPPEISDEEMVQNFVNEESDEKNTTPEDERVLQEAAVAVEETLTSLQIPEEQWSSVIERTRIQ